MADVKKYFEDGIGLIKWMFNWALRTVQLIIKSEGLTPTGKMNLCWLVFLIAYSVVKGGKDFTEAFIYLGALSIILASYNYNNELKLKLLSGN